MKTLLIFFLICLSGTVASAQKVLTIQGDGHDPLSTEGMKISGTFSEKGYDNRILGFSIDAPVGFDRMEDPATKEMLAKGNQLSKQTVSATQREEKSKALAEAPILFHYTTKGGSFIAGLIKVRQGTTSRVYAESNILALKDYPNAKLSKSLSEKTFGGRAWQAYEVELTTEGGVVNQLYLIRVELGHALYLIGSNMDAGIETKIIDSLNSIRFKK